MAFELPIVATIREGGVTFRVRALPWGLAREAAMSDVDGLDIAARIYERCVEAVDGDDRPAGISLDELPVSLVRRLVDAANGARADGPAANPLSPPSSTARGSGG